MKKFVLIYFVISFFFLLFLFISRTLFYDLIHFTALAVYTIIPPFLRFISFHSWFSSFFTWPLCAARRWNNHDHSLRITFWVYIYVWMIILTRSEKTRNFPLPLFFLPFLSLSLSLFSHIYIYINTTVGHKRLYQG